LRKAVSLLNKIEAKTGSGSGSASGTVALDATSLAALENISVTFPSTQNVNVTNAGLNVSVTNLPATQPVSGSVSVSNFPATQPVSGTFWQATQPVSGSVSVSNFPSTQAVTIASAPVTPVTDNGGSLTVDGTFWPATQPVSGSVSVSNFPATQPISGSISVSNFPATQPVSLATAPTTPVTGTFWQATQPVSLASVPSHAVTGSGSFTAAQTTAANLNATVVGSGSFTAAQATASNLKAQAQLLNAAGSVVDYAMTGTAGTPATDVVTVQGISGGTVIPVSVSNLPGTQAVSGTFWPTTQPVSGSVSVSNFPATQPVSLASVPSHPVTGTFWQATQPVSIANPPVTPVTDNNGSLTVDGTVTSRIADGAGNNLTSVARGSERALSVQIVDASGAQVTTFGGGGGGGTVTATQTTPSALKAQAQILDATGSQMSFVNAGIAGTPSVDVLTVQGSTTGTPIPVRVAAYSAGSSVTFSSFTSTTSLAFAGVDSNRKVLTIFNEGNGTLYIKPAAYSGDVVSITNYQIRMSPGDYWEVPAAQLGLQHLGIFASAGTARITSIS
jgi:hypothetical protein